MYHVSSPTSQVSSPTSQVSSSTSQVSSPMSQVSSPTSQVSSPTSLVSSPTSQVSSSTSQVSSSTSQVSSSTSQVSSPTSQVSSPTSQATCPQEDISPISLCPCPDHRCRLMNHFRQAINRCCHFKKYGCIQSYDISLFYSEVSKKIFGQSQPLVSCAGVHIHGCTTPGSPGVLHCCRQNLKLITLGVKGLSIVSIMSKSPLTVCFCLTDG